MDAALTKQMQKWQKDLDERIKDHKKVPHYWEYPELEKGNVHKHCAHCQKRDCQRMSDPADPPEDKACNVVECRWKCGAVLHHCKLFEHKVKSLQILQSEKARGNFNFLFSLAITDLQYSILVQYSVLFMDITYKYINAFIVSR